MPPSEPGLPRGGSARSHPLRRGRPDLTMRVELSKDYGFEAAHRLPNAPPGHKCQRMHGHSYRIEVTIAGEVEEHAGWLQDFAAITAVVGPPLQPQPHPPTPNPR